MGGNGVTEKRYLNWKPVSGKNPLYGKTESKDFTSPIQCTFLTDCILAQSRLYGSSLERSALHTDEDYPFLNGETTKDGSASCWAEDADGQHLQCVITNSDAGWTMEQTWGFENIDGKRYHTRRMVVRKGDQVERGRLVYNYNS